MYVGWKREVRPLNQFKHHCLKWVKVKLPDFYTYPRTIRENLALHCRLVKRKERFTSMNRGKYYSHRISLKIKRKKTCSGEWNTCSKPKTLDVNLSFRQISSLWSKRNKQVCNWNKHHLEWVLYRLICSSTHLNKGRRPKGPPHCNRYKTILSGQRHS